MIGADSTSPDNVQSPFSLEYDKSNLPEGNLFGSETVTSTSTSVEVAALRIAPTETVEKISDPAEPSKVTPSLCWALRRVVISEAKLSTSSITPIIFP